MKKISDGLKVLLFKEQASEHLREKAVVMAANQILSSLSDKIQAQQFSSGILCISARNQYWRNEAKHHQKKLIQLINNSLELETIQRIKWVSWVSLPKRDSAEKIKSISSAPGKSSESPGFICDGIQDPKVKKAMKSLLESIWKHRKTGITRKIVE